MRTVALTFALGLAVTSLSIGASPASSAASPGGRGIAAERRFADEIERAAHRFKVDPAWIRAVIERESAYDPRALSHAGAQGLMQVMPETYAALARRHGLGSDPFQPADNIMAGAAYLRDMYDLFGEPGLFAAYNAGPGRYRDHLETGRPLPRETVDYVVRVLASLARDGAATPSLGLDDRLSARREIVLAVDRPARDQLFVDRAQARIVLGPRASISSSVDRR
ncbi:transglycosylase SLT domain-containing protein [Brevundimonas sp. 1080]|uniref:lytic transglycosylase domain-containing protein n=1 Tax=Brevundimonas sp. 1080 TaxID=3156405 RepID=UPI00339655E0